MAKDNTYKRKCVFGPRKTDVQKQKRNVWSDIICDPGSGDYHCPDRFSVSV